MDEQELHQQIANGHRDLISMELVRAGIEEERSALLGDYRNVLRGLADRSLEDWALLRAAMLHIARSESLKSGFSQWLGEEISTRFETEAKSPLYYLTLETQGDGPVARFDPHEVFPKHRMTTREATFYYSRAALAILVSKDDPKRAIKLFEDLKPFDVSPVLFLLPTCAYCVPLDQELSLLPYLYEKVGRFEDALNSAPIAFQSFGTGVSPWDVAIRRLEGWLHRLCQFGSVSEVERFLDMIYEWLDNARDVDEEERDQIGDCPTATRQLWAWFYGNALGRLLAARPSLLPSLLDEIEAGEWEGCWHVAGLLFEVPPQSWAEYRQRAVRFYNSSDIEYCRDGPIPWDATQPPHLSAQSDLYWAIRIGFADAHTDFIGGQRAATVGITESLEQIRTIASSTAHHVLRTEQVAEKIQADLQNRVMPNDEFWYERLRERLPYLLNVLPLVTVGHLISALRHEFAREWDNCSLDLCKAVESLFHQILEPTIKQLPALKDLKVVVPRPRNSPRKYSLGDWSRIQVSAWSNVIETTVEQGRNADLRSALPCTFPNIDLTAFNKLGVDLGRISQLRGSSAHDSSTSGEQRAENARKLWDLVVRYKDDGFLGNFYSALGLAISSQA